MHNNDKSDGDEKEYAKVMFQVEMLIVDDLMSPIFVPEYLCRKVELEDEYYYKGRPVYARGRGCAATWEKKAEEINATAIKSSFIPDYEIPSVSAQIDDMPEHAFSMLQMGLPKKKSEVIQNLRTLTEMYGSYFTVSIILQLMVQQIDAELIIDRKDFSGDKFDDLKLKMPNGNTEFQTKYSDEENSHKLTKDDLANGNGHDTALCDLFASWKMRKESENDTQIKLCLAWNRPTDDDPITEFLKPVQEQSLPFSVVAYSFDGDVFWPAGKLPPKGWRKFNTAIKLGLIDREAFLAFCNELTIILEMPKASLDLKVSVK